MSLIAQILSPFNRPQPLPALGLLLLFRSPRYLLNFQIYNKPSHQYSGMFDLLFMSICDNDIPGGKLCFNLSALSASFSTRVYKNLRHRILNLIWFVFCDFLIRAAVTNDPSQHSETAMIADEEGQIAGRARRRV